MIRQGRGDPAAGHDPGADGLQLGSQARAGAVRSDQEEALRDPDHRQQEAGQQEERGEPAAGHGAGAAHLLSVSRASAARGPAAANPR